MGTRVTPKPMVSLGKVLSFKLFDLHVRVLSKNATRVKVTHRPVAPPRAPMKKFRKPKKILLP